MPCDDNQCQDDMGMSQYLQDDTIKKGLIAAEAEENHANWRSHSHILISVAGAIGATQLQYLAQELNQAANAANKQEAQPLNLRCINGISKVEEFLNNEKQGST